MTSFLDGRVLVEKLTSVQDKSRRFRGGDARGEVAMIAADSEIRFVEFVEFSDRNIQRGNHYHDHYMEQIYVIKGCLLLIARALDTGKKEEIPIEAGEIVTIQPRIAHRLQSLAPSLAISMGKGSDPFVDRFLYGSFESE